jgi:hypothetical protein
LTALGDYQEGSNAVVSVYMTNTDIDKIAVQGQATLKGKLLIAPASPDTVPKGPYTVLTYNSVEVGWKDKQGEALFGKWIVKNKTFLPSYGNSALTLSNPLKDGNGLNIFPKQGIPFNDVVANFTDPGYENPQASDYTATIDWGDNNISTATSIEPYGNGFNIKGSNTYLSIGKVPTAITIVRKDDPDDSITVYGTATVSSSIPVAIDDDDGYDVLQNTSLVMDAPGVLENDFDPNELPLTAHKASDPEHGSVTLIEDGSFTYVPDNGYFGSDWFTYYVNNGLYDSDAATVLIMSTRGPRKPY